VFGAHLIQVQGQVLSAEKMIELDRSSVGQLLASVEFLKVSIVFFFDEFLSFVFHDFVIDLFNVFFDLQDHLRSYHAFSSFVFYNFFKLILMFLLLSKQILSSYVDFTRLLDFDSKKTLFKQVACILNARRGFWNHFDTTIGHSI